MGNLSIHFDSKEFECRCECGYATPSSKLIYLLEELRNKWGYPIYVGSGCRCYLHNLSINGAKNSYHLNGMAADIYPAMSRQFVEMMGYSNKEELITRFGKLASSVFDSNGTIVYLGSLFVHVDVRGYNYKPLPKL